MAERFLHTFDEWMVRVNKRLTSLERRKAPPGGSGGTVPDPLNIGTINVSAKATVPAPLDPTDATTKEYVDDADAATLAAANAHADTAAAAAQTAATQYLADGTNTTVTGAGTAASPWRVNATPASGPGAWTSVGYNSAWRALQSVDLWQIRDTGDGMRETSQVLVTPTASSLTLTANTYYVIGTLPPGMEQPATRRGPYYEVQIRGSVVTNGLVVITAGSSDIRVLPNVTTTLTSGSQYISLDAMRWVY